MKLLGYEIRKKSTVIQSLQPSFIPLSFISDYISSSIGATDQKFIEYYFTVPELQAIVNYRSRCFAGMKVRARRVNTGQEIEKHPVLDLIQQPNVLQVFDEFAKQYLISKDIFGNAYTYMLYGAKPINSAALFNLPAMNCEIKTLTSNINPFEQTDIKSIIKQYDFWFRGERMTYEPDDIIHFYDNLIFDNQTATSNFLKGKSKLQPLTQVLENIKSSYETRGILIGNSPMGIISNRTKDAAGIIPMTADEKKAVQEEMKQYGISKKKWQFVISSADLQFSSMAVNIGNLKLFEEVDADQSAIADAFGFPVELFHNNVTYENKKEAKKQLYQDSIIPEAEEWLSGLSSGLGLLDSGIELYPDFSHVPALQDDLTSKSQMWNTTMAAINTGITNGTLTVEEGRILLEKIGMI